MGLVALGVAGLAAIAGGLAVGGAATAAAKEGVVVHEWGTFTTIAGTDGVALDWRPLAGPTDLPSFVYGPGAEAGAGLRFGGPCEHCAHASCTCGPSCATECQGGQQCQCKTCIVAPVRMETPVIYFYAEEETALTVRVGFPGGQITEWYPRARQVGGAAGGIDWGKIAILPSVEATLPREPGDSHYYPAREVDAATVRVCALAGGDWQTEHERFLFYRGAGRFDLPLVASLTPLAGAATGPAGAGGPRHEGLTLRNAGAEPIAVLLFAREGDRVWFRTPGHLGGGDERGLLLPGQCCAWADADLLPDGTRGEPLAGVKRALFEVLTAEGLYPKEARAMLATWESSWFEEGLRVFYVVPRSVTDAVLPLAIEPPPAETVRVLVGRTELITERQRCELTEALAALDAPEPARAAAAEATIRRYGRFAEPILRELGAIDDTASPLRARLEAIAAATTLDPAPAGAGRP